MPRNSRLHEKGVDDQRNDFEKDRDRILYSTALRRLGGITQVVGAAEGHVFHNRLTHTLEVAQLSRRFAQQLLHDQPDVAAAVGGVDPEVAEAAALAHDLGHPPFGHIAEEELDELVTREPGGVPDGFEGNAQSFRIVTYLSVRSNDYRGQNLTAATLNAILKYPWFRTTEQDDVHRHRKYGAYHLQTEDFDLARSDQPGDDHKSAEAEIMDWSDDIAYAVHDMEDFYRAGLVPLHLLMQSDEAEAQRFLDGTFDRWKLEGVRPAPTGATDDELGVAFLNLLRGLAQSHLVTRPYEGGLDDRAVLRGLSSELISRYVLGVIPELQPPFRLRETTQEDRRVVEIQREARLELAMLKQLTWFYVIQRASLSGQQLGQRRIVSNLYEVFRDATVTVKSRDKLPPSARQLMEKNLNNISEEPTDDVRRRVAADVVCSLSEQQAAALHRRYTGIDSGSIMEAPTP